MIRKKNFDLDLLSIMALKIVLIRNIASIVKSPLRKMLYIGKYFESL